MEARKIIKTYLWIVLYTIAPVLCILVSSAIASATGSKLDESGAHPCIILGVDVGIPLVILFTAGWFGLVTIPTGVIWLLVFTISWMIKKRRAKAAASTREAAPEKIFIG